MKCVINPKMQVIYAWECSSHPLPFLRRANLRDVNTRTDIQHSPVWKSKENEKFWGREKFVFGLVKWYFHTVWWHMPKISKHLCQKLLSITKIHYFDGILKPFIGGIQTTTIYYTVYVCSTRSYFLNKSIQKLKFGIMKLIDRSKYQDGG